MAQPNYTQSDTTLQIKGVTMGAEAFRHCIFILDELLSCYDCFQFLAPVPLTAVVYHTEIKNPMDFKTLENNLYQNKYKEYKDFQQDLCLIWDNAKLFHRSFDTIYQQAENLNKRYMGLEDFINGGPQPLFLASPQSDIELILESLLPEEKMKPLIEPTVVFPMYKELEPPNKSNLYFVQALSEQDCATKKLRGFSNVRLLFQHLNASFFEYMSEPRRYNSVPLPRFYIAKNRTLLNEAGMDPDGAMAVLYNVQTKPLNKELYRLQATVVISEPMGETHGFDESSMDKSNEYEFCPKAWLKLRVIKVVENVNTVINADMDRSFFKKVYNTYKLSTKIPSDLKKVGNNDIAREFVQAILNPVPSSTPLPVTATAAKSNNKPTNTVVTNNSPVVVTNKPVVTTTTTTTTTTTANRPKGAASQSVPPRTRTISQQKSASPAVSKATISKSASPSLKEEPKPTALVQQVVSPSSSHCSTKTSISKKKNTAPHTKTTSSAITKHSEPTKNSVSNISKLKSPDTTPLTSQVRAPLKKQITQTAVAYSPSARSPSSARNLIRISSPSLCASTSDTATDQIEKPVIRLVLKQPVVISHDNDEDEPMSTANGNANDEESESESEEEGQEKDEKKDDKKDDDEDRKNDDRKDAYPRKGDKKDYSNSDESVEDDSDGSSSPPPEADEWYTDGDEDSVEDTRERISPALDHRYVSTATSSQTDSVENQLRKTNVSFERYMEDNKEYGSKGNSIPKEITATKQYYIDASKELWEKLRSYAKEKNVPVVDINTYVDKTSSFPNAEGFFKHVYFLKEDHQKVVQTFRRMTITQRTTEIASLLALKGLPHMGQITEVLEESHGEIIGLSMQRYQKTLKQYTHAHSHHRLTAHQKMDLVIQMLECIETIHKVGLAHRDLSEVNFMVNETDEKLRDGSPRAELFLIDFGKSTFTHPEDVRRWWIEHPTNLHEEYDGEVVPLTKEDLDIWCQQLPWIRSKPDHGYRLYRSVQTLPRSRTDTDDLPWLINPLSEDMYSLGTIIWKTFSETEPWYGILDTDIKGLRETVGEDYHIERALQREVSGKLSNELLLKFLKISPEHRSTATEVLNWLQDLKIQDGLIKEWEEHAPVGRQKRHAKALFRYDDEQAASTDLPQRKKQKSNNTTHNNNYSATNSAPTSPLLIHIPPSIVFERLNTKSDFDNSGRNEKFRSNLYNNPITPLHSQKQ